jgi:hypothetical protein
MASMHQNQRTKATLDAGEGAAAARVTWSLYVLKY